MRILYEGSLYPPGVSGVTGPALRETSCINRSLAALSDVLGALAEGRGHIPYRNIGSFTDSKGIKYNKKYSFHDLKY